MANSAYEKVYTNPMTSMREGSEDVHVRSYVAYGKTADHKLYLESSYKTQIDQADIEHAFKRNALLIFDGTNYLIPVSMNGEKVSTVGTTTVTQTSGSATVAALVEWSAKATV